MKKWRNFSLLANIGTSQVGTHPCPCQSVTCRHPQGGGRGLTHSPPPYTHQGTVTAWDISLSSWTDNLTIKACRRNAVRAGRKIGHPDHKGSFHIWKTSESLCTMHCTLDDLCAPTKACPNNSRTLLMLSKSLSVKRYGRKDDT